MTTVNICCFVLRRVPPPPSSTCTLVLHFSEKKKEEALNCSRFRLKFQFNKQEYTNAMTLFRLSLTAAFCACNLALSVEKAYADSDASSTDAAEDMTHDSGGAYDDDAFDLARLRIDHEYKSEV